MPLPVTGKTNKRVKLANIACSVLNKPRGTATHMAELAKITSSLSQATRSNQEDGQLSIERDTQKTKRASAYLESIKSLPAKRARSAKEMATAVESTQDSGSAMPENRAAWILEQNTKHGRKINDKDIAEVLDVWTFKDNKKRTNVMPEGTKSVNSGCWAS